MEYKKNRVIMEQKQFFDYFLQVDIKTNECLLDKFHAKDDFSSLSSLINVLNNNPHLVPKNLLKFVKRMPGVVQKNNYLTFDGATYFYYENFFSKMDDELITMLEKRKLEKIMSVENVENKNVLKI